MSANVLQILTWEVVDAQAWDQEEDCVLTFAIIWLREQVTLIKEVQVRFQSMEMNAVKVLKLGR
jgi:hypothetical protein